MPKNVLLTGITGYVGIRLLNKLLEKNYNIRCVARHTDDLKFYPWAEKVEILKGDFFSGINIEEAMKGIDVAFYLIHSMGDFKDFEKREEIIARNFAKAAKKNNVKKVIYLGGLGEDKENLSRHLRSRHKVGKILREEGLNVVEFRAGIIVGSGSVSFEMIRYISERFPFIPNFKYLKNSSCQIIAIRDVLSYLTLAIEKEESNNKILEIGSNKSLKYIEMLEIYCKIRNLKKFHLHMPCIHPSICASLISIITPLPYNIVRALIESLKNNAVKKDFLAEEIFPEIKPLNYNKALEYALNRIEKDDVESIWSNSYIPNYHKPSVFIDKEGMIFMKYEIEINSSAKRIYDIFSSIGGENGYFFANILWKIKGWQDKLIGGIGLRNGRRNKREIYPGEILDFFRVEKLIPNKMMLLNVEMKLPGKGWLKFDIDKIKEEKSIFNIIAYFEPKGFLGYFYWYILFPLHNYIFKGLIKKIKEKAEK